MGILGANVDVLVPVLVDYLAWGEAQCESSGNVECARHQGHRPRELLAIAGPVVAALDVREPCRDVER